MFGYVKPVPAELKVKEYELYKALYCGLCSSLGKRVTCSSKLTLSYDFVFLAVIRMALAKETGKIVRKRCLAHPTKKRPLITESKQLDYCARVSALLTYHKLLDDRHDEKGLKKFGVLLLMPAAKRMRKKAFELASLDAVIAEKLAEQQAMEDARETSPDAVAEPFGELLGSVCAEGFPEDSETFAIGRKLGRHLGRFLYLADAIDDLEKDLASSSYNPFAAGGGDDPLASFAERKEALRASLTMELVGMEEAVLKIDFSFLPTFESITKNILYLGLPALRDSLLDHGKKPERLTGEETL